MTLKILALGGDGIGPEVVDAALNLGKMTRDLGGTPGSDAMTDAVIEQFRALWRHAEFSLLYDLNSHPFTIQRSV
jgi:isocitrate/isopropylmalate dehydrogenase